MMMKALEAGGMDAAYSVQRDERMNRRWGEPDYKPNESYCELDPEDYRDPNFPAAYEGKLIKCLAGGLLKLRPISQYRIVFMRRDAKEIQQSLVAFFGKQTDIACSSNFQEMLSSIVEISKDRKSILSIDQIDYKHVVDNPLEVFQKLSMRGWPIDPDKSAIVPKRRHRRFVA